jgi:peptidyl-prolyl cis-trans isomerase A (cyclophilin A)
VAEQLYATLKTNHGDIEVRLLPNHAPKTVKNFVELAKGEREWTNPRPVRSPRTSSTTARSSTG